MTAEEIVAECPDLEIADVAHARATRPKPFVNANCRCELAKSALLLFVDAEARRDDEISQRCAGGAAEGSRSAA